MARHAGPVLVDTNIILERYRVGSWRALAGGYSVETVEECVEETQAFGSGFASDSCRWSGFSTTSATERGFP